MRCSILFTSRVSISASTTSRLRTCWGGEGQAWFCSKRRELQEYERRSGAACGVSQHGFEKIPGRKHADEQRGLYTSARQRRSCARILTGAM